MSRLIIALCALFLGHAAAQAQTVTQIRKVYGEAKQMIADNGKDGMVPLDVRMTIRGGTEVSDGEFLDEESQLTFYFTKYRTDTSLGYPDASSCYFVTENRTSNGHTSYREILFDPNEGYLLFSFMRAETHAGFVVESRYYYDAGGQLVEQKHKLGGQEATPDAQSWTTAEGDRELAAKCLDIFEMLMNQKNKPTAQAGASQPAKGNPARMKYIRNTYAQAKEKVEQNGKSQLPRDLQIVIRDQSSGPPVVTDLKLYYDVVQSDGASPHCYFVSKHSHNDMGLDDYSEYLFKPQSRSLIFSYCRSVEENQKNEWRYYFDDSGHCIEAKTDAEAHDSGNGDKQTAKRYQDLFRMTLSL